MKRLIDMTKSYPERLGEWVEQRTSTPREKNLAAFLAIREDVEAALAARFPVKTIWKHMHESGQIEIAYDTFRLYVKRHIRQRVVPTSWDANHQDVPRRTTPANPSSAGGRGAEQLPNTVPGFTFNAAPRKEELI